MGDVVVQESRTHYSVWTRLTDLIESRDLIWMMVLLACLIQFTAAWIWVQAGEEGKGMIGGIDRPYAYPFQTSLWGMIALSLMIHVRFHGMDVIGAVLKPFTAFLIVGLLASAFGVSPFSSLRQIALWGVAVLGATVLGHRLAVRGGDKALLVFLLMILIASLVLVFVQAGAASDDSGMDGGGWRGAFSNKNAFGWASAVTFVIAMASIDRGRRRLPLGVMVIAIVCLIGSESRAALVAAVSAVPFFFLSRYVLGRLSRPFAVGVQIFYVLLLILLGQVLLPIVLELLGRDSTFTGRTEIWSVYLRSMLDTPWLGQGPGAYTGASEITDRLLRQLGHLGYIYTPHNMYLGVFGDAGVLGLLTHVGTLIYIAFVAPLRYPGRWSSMAGTIGLLVIAGGLAETREIYSAGLGIFIMVYLRAGGLRAAQEQAPVVDA